MRRKHRVDNRQEAERKKPDCCLCIHRKGCERYAEGSWCTQFQSQEPEPEGKDPNEAWKRGEEVEF